MYEKEAVDQEAKVEKMKDDKKDEYDIRKQVRLSPPPFRPDLKCCMHIA